MATTTTNPNSILPPPSENQNYVTVSPLAGGFITLPDKFFVTPADPEAKRTVPSLTFLITHPGTSTFDSTDASKPFHLMFDLGLRKSREAYPDVLRKHLDSRAPFDLHPGVAAQLQAGGLDPSEVNLVILSHVHYDHHGDPLDFPSANFKVGHGGLKVLAHGLGAIASHQHFDANTLPPTRSSEFSNPETNETGDWNPLGPFPKTQDLFKDGSVYVIDTPGHLPGHLNLLCRTKERWICLCGDAFHDRRLLTGELEIGTWEGAHGEHICIHLDRAAAETSIRRLREFDEMCAGEVELIAAHEEVWWERNKSKQFPGKI